MCTIVDGASIPEAFWSFIGGPFEGKYRNASVVHDFYCDTRTETWEDVHMVFYNGMRAAGVDPITAKIMYSAVYNFGPRWLQVNPGYTKKLIAGTPILLKDAKEAIVKFIQDNDPSLSEIRTISDKLSQLENFTQLEQLLEQYANCTPIIANEGGAHEFIEAHDHSLRDERSIHEACCASQHQEPDPQAMLRLVATFRRNGSSATDMGSWPMLSPSTSARTWLLLAIITRLACLCEIFGSAT